MATPPPGPPQGGMPGMGGMGGMAAGPGAGKPGAGPGVMAPGKPQGPQGEAAPGGPQGATPPPSPEQMFKSVLQIGDQIDATLKTFAQAMPQGAAEFAQATVLIQQGIAKAISALAGREPPTSSSTAAGRDFPGGGFTSSPKPGM